jgi:hypothetical protein
VINNPIREMTKVYSTISWPSTCDIQHFSWKTSLRYPVHIGLPHSDSDSPKTLAGEIHHLANSGGHISPAKALGWFVLTLNCQELDGTRELCGDVRERGADSGGQGPHGNGSAEGD